MENNQDHEYVIYDIRLNVTPEENKLLEEKFQRYEDEYGIYIMVTYLEEIYQTYAAELSSFNTNKMLRLHMNTLTKQYLEAKAEQEQEQEKIQENI